MDKEQADEWVDFLAMAEDMAARPGETLASREPSAPAWWHGEDDAAETMLAFMGRRSAGR